MSKIHELLPVEQDKLAAAKLLSDEAIVTFTKKADHFQGHVKTTTMYADSRSAENTMDVKELVESVPSKLDHVWTGLIAAIDVSMAKENSNTSPEARADVIVDGKVVLKNLPTTALLALEKRVGALRDLYSAVPTLDPGVAWDEDPDAALPGVKRSRYPIETQKTEKVMRVLTLAEATDKHPAQVEKYTMDENVAKVKTDRTSGMVTPFQKSQWLSNIAKLQTAVKEARQRANMAEVVPMDLGRSIRDFIHGAA